LVERRRAIKAKVKEEAKIKTELKVKKESDTPTKHPYFDGYIRMGKGMSVYSGEINVDGLSMTTAMTTDDVTELEKVLKTEETNVKSEKVEKGKVLAAKRKQAFSLIKVQPFSHSKLAARLEGS